MIEYILGLLWLPMMKHVLLQYIWIYYFVGENPDCVLWDDIDVKIDIKVKILYFFIMVSDFYLFIWFKNLWYIL